MENSISFQINSQFIQLRRDVENPQTQRDLRFEDALTQQIKIEISVEGNQSEHQLEFQEAIEKMLSEYFGIEFGENQDIIQRIEIELKGFDDDSLSKDKLVAKLKENAQKQVKTLLAKGTVEVKNTKLAIQVEATQEKPKRVDPIIINLDGDEVKFDSSKFLFDLNSDEDLKQLPFFESNSAFLAWDKNQNGKVDNGQELFDPSTGHGFDELERLDNNQDGTLNKEDPLYLQLSLWDPRNSFQKNFNHQPELTSLEMAGIQQLNLRSELDSRPLLDSSHNLVAWNKESSTFTSNSHQGSIQEMDFIFPA